MNVRMSIIAITVALFAASTSFAGATAPKAPKPSAEKDSGKQFAEAMTVFKEKAGHPTMAGMCDKKGETYATHVVLWEIDEIQLFEIKNSGQNFFYLRSGSGSLAFYQEKVGKFTKIDLGRIPGVLKASGASEFLKSLDPSLELNHDCVAKKLEPGITDK